jgi:uncharacterized protein YndB with AHSA1/START domain
MGAQRKSAADNELLIVRTFNAPPSVVFTLCSSVEHMKRWMGRKGFTCPKMAIDLRVGGRYRGMIKSADHGENWLAASGARLSPTSGSCSPSPGRMTGRPQGSTW